jgi:hypothetical protein
VAAWKEREGDEIAVGKEFHAMGAFEGVIRNMF